MIANQKVGAVKDLLPILEQVIQAGQLLIVAEEPVRQLAYNAGLEGSVVVNQVRSAKKGQGLNVETGEIEDLVKAGIIDPTMVTRSALQNAASIAKNILTTEAIVAEAPEKATAGTGMPGGMGGMVGMATTKPSLASIRRGVRRAEEIALSPTLWCSSARSATHRRRDSVM